MPQQFTTPLLLVLMVAAFYFLMIRPQQKRAKAQRETLTALGPGTRVLLANGFYATVVSVLDTAVEVELSPGVVSLVVKQAIVQVVSPEVDPATPASAYDDEAAEELEADSDSTDERDAEPVTEQATPLADPEPNGSRSERFPRSDS